MSGNNGWIEINLPWRKYTDPQENSPPYPQKLVDKLVREKFGQTIEELESLYAEKYGKSSREVFYDIKFGLEDEHPFDESVYEEDYERYQKEIEGLIENSQEPMIVEMRTLTLARGAIEEFIDQIPEVITWARAFDRFCRQLEEEDKKASFSLSDLCRPGVLIEVQDTRGNKKRYLIGDINCNSGVCDDCTVFEPESIVLRAKVMVDLELLSFLTVGLQSE
jgi:hypothetical protein